MHLKRSCFGLLMAGAMVLVLARVRAEPAISQAGTTPSSALEGNTIARIHWMGINQIAKDTNSATFMTVWNMPETRKLEQQTLAKLALAPWTLLLKSGQTNQSERLEPVLADLVQNEFYLEAETATNGTGALALAVRLGDDKAHYWDTNLTKAVQSLTHIAPQPAGDGHTGWALRKHDVPNFIQLTRVGTWTVVGAAQNANPVLDQVVRQLKQGDPPFSTEATNDWLTATLDLAKFAKAFALGWNLPKNWPAISVNLNAEGTNLITDALLDFPQALNLDLGDWNIPTNMVHAPVASFFCVRGLQPWLNSFETWKRLQIGPAPSQICLWSLQGSLSQTYGTALLPNASDEVNRLTELVLRKSNAVFPTNDLFGFQRPKDQNGLEWSGLPYLWPTLKSVSTNGGSFAFLSLFPSAAGADWPPPELPWDLLHQTNLMAYDWEKTGPRVESWLFIGQFIRFVMRQPQLPFDSASVAWLKAVPHKLHESLTRVEQSGPSEISITRKSTIGFTGAELQLLADWLESPRFPLGLHTFEGKLKDHGGGQGN